MLRSVKRGILFHTSLGTRIVQHSQRIETTEALSVAFWRWVLFYVSLLVAHLTLTTA
ncbi:hypothetical protein BDW60DRAFT_60589 [Aspergillus nidulans var. acristatus]